MQTDVRALSEVDYALDIHVPTEDIQAQVTDALKKERGQISLKGFRPGRVPMGVVRKMVGPQVAVHVAETAIGEAYRQAVVEAGEDAYDIVGQPRLVHLEFDVDDPEAALQAEVRFGVRPEIALAELDGVPVTRLVRAFTDEDIDADLERRRALAATLEDEPEGTAIGEDHVAIVDIQPVDADGEPTGPQQEGAEIVLANPNLRAELRDGLLGQTAGAEVRVDFPHEPEVGVSHHADDETDPDDHVDRYRIAVRKVQRRDLPEMTDEWAKEHTSGAAETVDALREEARKELETSWERRSRQALESKMVEAFVEAHGHVAVPEVLVESAIDAMLDDVRKRSGDAGLPAGFDVAAYREQARPQAERQVRWLLVKEALVEQEGLEVTNEDFEAEFERIAGGEDVEGVKGFFEQQPQMLQQMGDHLLNQRVFGALESRFDVVDKTREDLEAEAEARKGE